MANFSASSVERVMLCPVSAVLPQTTRSDRWTSRGNIIHEFLRAVPSVGVEAALGAVPVEFHDLCESIDLNRLPACSPESYAAEVAFAYDVETGTARELGRNIDRNYEGLKPTEIPGTADTVGLSEDAVLIGDYKPGFQDVTPAAENWQLRTLAVAASKAYKKSRAVVSIIRLSQNGDPWFDTATFDEFDLATFEEELRTIHSTIESLAGKELLETHEGDHCQYCPALPYCPSKMTLVRQFAAAPEGLEINHIEGATDEQLAMAYERASAVEKVVERVKNAIRARARQAPIPMGEGQVLGPVDVEELVLDKATEVLKNDFGEAVAEAAVAKEPTISKKSVERALKALVLKDGMKITHIMRDTLKAIRDAGGVRTVKEIRKHKPKSPELTEGTPGAVSQ